MSNLPNSITFRNCPSNRSSSMNTLPITCQIYPPTITFRSCPPRYLVKCPPNYPIICQICPSNYLLCPLNNPITCQIFPPNYLSRSSIQLPLKMSNQYPSYLSNLLTHLTFAIVHPLTFRNCLSNLSTPLPFEIVHPITFKIPQ